MSDNASERSSAVLDGENNGIGNGRKLPLRGNYAPPETERVDVLRLLDELEELPDRATQVPWLKLQWGFDQDRFDTLLLKIRANLPEEVKKAQRVARESERIVDEARDVAVRQMESVRVEAARTTDDARSEAARIVEQARMQAAHMVEHSEVHRMATAQAQDILRRAEIEASEIRKGADDYARDVLGHIENVMEKAVVVVQKGRETLDKTRG